MSSIRHKVIILGSSGFIGSAVLRRLQKANDLDVVGYTSSSLDLSQPDAWKKLSELLNPKTILIVAARSRGTDIPLDALQTDIAIASNVGKCLERTQVHKCIYFSSTSVYGTTMSNLNVTEETEPHPTLLYGIGKLASEYILSNIARKHGIDLAILRVCMVYGPDDRGDAYGPTKFIRSIRQNQEVRLFGDGRERRNYIFVEDLAQITETFVVNDQKGIFNVASDDNCSFLEIVDYLQEIMPDKFEIRSVGRDQAKIDQKINCEKLKAVLQGFLFTPFEEGLRITCGASVNAVKIK